MAMDPELEAARAAGLIPDPLALAAQQLGGPAPPAPQLLSIADQTHASPDVPTIAPAPPALDTTRATVASPPAAGPAPAEGLPLPAGVPSQEEAHAATQAAAEAAIRVGPDVKTSGIDKRSKAAIRAKEIELQRNDAAKVGTVQRDTQVQEEKANEVARDEDEKRLDRLAQEANQAAERAELEAAHVAAKDEAKRLRGDLAKDYERGLFETQGTAKTWLGALSVGLGSFAANWNKTPNFAWQILERAMDDHAAREKGRLLRKKEEIERQGGDVKEALAAIRDYDTITKPQQQAALLQRAADRRAALLARYGADEARINGDRLIQQINENRLIREMDVEKGLATRVEVDNSDQQRLRRQLALGQPGGKPLTEGERKGVATVEGALNGLKRGLENTKELDAKDKKIFRKIENEARSVKESDPAKAWTAFAQITGNYYSQLSENGSRRLRGFENYFRDLERNTSGAVIGPAETMGHIAEAIEPGGVKYALDRARAMSSMAGTAKGAARASIDAFERGLSSGGGGAPAQAPAASAASTRARAIEMLRGPGLSAKDRAAVDWAREHPTDPRAADILKTARSKGAN